MSPDLPGAGRCFALVPCAGVGQRAQAGLPKQYATLGGRALVRHTLQALREVAAISAVLVVISSDDDHFERLVPAAEQSRDWLVRAGGATRAQTVGNGLAALRERGAQQHDWVLVHDAARCLLRPAWVERLLDTCWHDEVGGLLALPLADTLKSASPQQPDRVASTVDREHKWAAQTPQMFRLGLLEPALRQAAEARVGQGPAITDESSAIEALGHAPRLVRGDLENLKITYQPDFGLAERLLASGRRGTELRPFVPARDFTLSQSFYTDLGFVREFQRGPLAGFRLGNSAFLLQDFYEPQLAENLMLHLTLPDLDSFWHRLEREGLAERYGVRVEPPTERPWGLKDMTVTDPSGVLWRIAQRMEVAE